jgi:adenylate kinase family enzyme
MKVINFFGGPGSGKSTAAATIFSQLKINNISC